MRISLFVKLIVAFFLVVAIGTGLMAFLANRAATGGLQLYISHDAELRAQQLAPILASYYYQVGSWDGVDELLSQPTPTVPIVRGQGRFGQGMMGSWRGMWWLGEQRLVLAEVLGRVVFDSEAELMGTKLGDELLASAVPLIVDGERVGSVLVAQGTDASLEQDFLDRVNRGLFLAGLGAALSALLFAALLARKITDPIRRLTVAAQGIAAGRLNQRVSVSSRDEAGQLAKAFNHMANQLESAEQERRQMLADIAHELRNPLSTLQGNLEGMLDEVLPLEPGQVATVYDQTLLLSRLVDDLRLLSLAQAHQLPLERSAIDIGPLVHRVVEDFRPLAHDRGIALHAKVPDQLPPALVDPQRISQVLANLLSNALRHVARGGRVAVAVDQAPAVLQVSVTDSGPGISPQDMPHVFERFYRVDKSRSRTGGGSGLGLAIAKGLIEAHGGRIWATSEPGEGSTFAFTIPT
ncbi:sensor histidine kinase [Chloroflexota bacterium]